MLPDVAKDAWIRRALDEGRYDVEDDGTIVNLKFGRRPVKQSLMSDGYCRVGLSIDGSAVYVKAHRVVAIRRVPNPRGVLFVNHDDGIKDHNHPSNLLWATAAENTQHAIFTGLFKPRTGEELSHSKLKFREVLAIRNLIELGTLTHGEIARRYGVGRSTITAIANAENWKQSQTLAA